MGKTRFQTRLLFAKLLQRPLGRPTQVAQTLRDVVGQPSIFRSRPDLLDRIQLRGIWRKPFDLEAVRKAFLQSACRRTMDTPAIQDPDDAPGEMTHDFDGEDLKILMANIAGIHPKKQPQPSSVGRDTQGRNHRQPIPAVPRIQNRGLTSRAPGSTNQRLKQQTGFVGHKNGSTAFSGFFLFGASPAYARRQWPVHPVPGPGTGVSDNSSPSLAGYARQWMGHSQSQNESGSPCQSAPASTIPWQTRNCGDFAAVNGADIVSAWHSAPAGVRCWGWLQDRLCRTADIWLSIAIRLRTLRPVVGPLGWFRFLVLTARRLDTAAVPMFFHYLGVSYP
jgi:hypothetical protein